ncbi:hypothetical protein AU210_014258 [Fusarium oxysporum f. sp. radicis-cucumerinum]|uniref:F-box domain-containing protein n=2 Tax=Fusarium oxysporum TaxID=5507 RepID=A0A2H3GJD4_FUSOX|nr:hypothetical protein AU210_014258 [Fusarium oxysporum f. sp. radicis-cucumerinum]RKK08028.1 hypothetical protein BFJ65_g17501 [Fusarium oxysporum f. sp. cepae]RKK31634.1 hypothetical protein BFJ67_g15133 [Fusarium oxysporum f. sp. cepae]RKK38917.1 hypothetical protein BFJ66_g12229 [Fusarium oxysporum f. sp. cepae]
MAPSNPNAALDRMPVELLLITGEDLDQQSMKALTLVSKRLRLKLLPYYPMKVTFTGDVSEIAARLALLMEEHPDSPSGSMYQYVKHACFNLEPSKLIPQSHPINDLVSDFCRQPTRLKKVTIFSYDIYKVLVTQAPQLKRLAVMGFEGMPRIGPNPRLTTRILDDIRHNFQQMETLVLGEFLNPKFPWGQQQFRTMKDRAELNIMVVKVSMALNSMPQLTRFAFVLTDETIGERVGTPEEWFYPWYRGQYDTKEEWYSHLVRAILGVVPGLQQLCVRARRSVYCRGTRIPADSNLTITWKTDQEETTDEFDNFFV